MISHIGLKYSCLSISPVKVFLLLMLVLLPAFGIFTGCRNNAGDHGNSLRKPFLHRNTKLPDGVWISPEKVKSLPTSGRAWERLKEAADEPMAMPDLSEQHSKANVKTLAKALVYVRTGEEAYREEVITACNLIPGSQRGGRTLALGKQLMAYVIAADLVELPEEDEQRFKSWLRDCLAYQFESGKTLRSTHETRPNNWGTLAGASRLAAAMYLGDIEEVKQCAEVFKGWLGDREIYAGFEYKDRSWQANPTKPVGINPQGAEKRGHSIDGVLPDDQRRGGSFTWPPPKENYAYTALQGAVAQAVMLERCGYNVWEWEDRALLRTLEWLYNVAEYPAEGNDMWMPFVINAAYDDTSFPTPSPTKPGKNTGWADWTHTPTDD